MFPEIHKNIPYILTDKWLAAGNVDVSPSFYSVDTVIQPKKLCILIYNIFHIIGGEGLYISIFSVAVLTAKIAPTGYVELHKNT